jgi:hypothetical protein
MHTIRRLLDCILQEAEHRMRSEVP